MGSQRASNPRPGACSQCGGDRRGESRTDLCVWNITSGLVRGQDQGRKIEDGEAWKEDGHGPGSRGRGLSPGTWGRSRYAGKARSRFGACSA